MKEIRSLTVSMELIERLRPLICCADTDEICKDDGFCGTDQGEWPHVQNGIAKTRLTYPQDENKPSVPDVPGFCADYLSWYSRTNCGALAKDIARSIPSPGKCPTSADAKEYMDRIVSQVPRYKRRAIEAVLKEHFDEVVNPAQQQCEMYEKNAYSLSAMLAERCGIMYDTDEDGNLKLNEDRADGLMNIAGFCRQVEAAEAERVNWKTFGGGGAAAAGGVGLAYYLSKILKAVKGVRDIDENTAGAARGLKRFFSYSLPNLGRSIKYALSFKWLRGEKPPDDIPDPTAKPADVEQSQQRIEIHLHQNGKIVQPGEPGAEHVEGDGLEGVPPSPDVVMAQFANLLNSRRYSREGEIFAGLSDAAQRYMAHNIVDAWNMEPSSTKQLFLKDDSRLLHGKMPIGYLFKYSRKYLTPEMIPIIEVSAEDWSKTGQLQSELLRELATKDALRPNIDDVYRQLIYDDRYSRADSAVQEYLARKAIALWEAMLQGERKRFMSESDKPYGGALPTGFVRFFRKKMIGNTREIKDHAVVFLQILNEVPELAGISFSIVDRRVGLLLRAWGMLSQGVRSAFWIQDGFKRLPHGQSELPSTFIEHMSPALKIGVVPRQTILPTDEPWKPEDSPPFSYRGFDLRELMSRVVELEERAAYYPTLLGQRARSIVDAWVSLAPSVRVRFVDDGTGDADSEADFLTKAGIPESFMRMWHAASPGIGLGSREADIDRDGATATAPGEIGVDSKGEGKEGRRRFGGVASSAKSSGEEADEAARTHAAKAEALIDGAKVMTGGETAASSSSAAVSAPPAVSGKVVSSGK